MEETFMIADGFALMGPFKLTRSALMKLSMLKVQAKKIELRCEECSITYSSQKRYDNHIEKHHTKVCLHKCPYCRYSSFKRRGSLTKHLSKVHPEMFYGINAEQKPPINSNPKPSIFHSIELLAQSDSNKSSSSSSH